MNYGWEIQCMRPSHTLKLVHRIWELMVKPITCCYDCAHSKQSGGSHTMSLINAVYGFDIFTRIFL